MNYRQRHISETTTSSALSSTVSERSCKDLLSLKRKELDKLNFQEQHSFENCGNFNAILRAFSHCLSIGYFKAISW